MKTLLLLTVSLLSVNALAKDLKCSGDIDFRGGAGKVTITLNDKDGLTIANEATDNMASSSMHMKAEKVEHWKEGTVPVVGKAPGIKIYLLSENHATLRRLEGWGTGNPEGDYADLLCE